MGKFLIIGTVFWLVGHYQFSYPDKMWPIDMANKSEYATMFGLTVTLCILGFPSIRKELFGKEIKDALSFIILLWVVIGAYLTMQEMRKDRLLSIRPHLAGAKFNGQSKAGGGVKKDLVVQNVGYGAAIIDTVYWDKPAIGVIDSSIKKGKAIPVNGELKFWISTIGKDTLKEPIERKLIIEYNNIGDAQHLKYTIRIKLGGGLLKIIE